MSHVGASGSKLQHAAVLALLVQSVAYCGARAQEMVVRQEPIPDSVWDEMQGKSWHDGIGCPSRAELVLLTVPYHDFQGQSQLGYLIVAAKAAADVAAAFKEITTATRSGSSAWTLSTSTGATTTSRWRPTTRARSTAAQ